jgi:hypothetical protein
MSMHKSHLLFSMLVILGADFVLQAQVNIPLDRQVGEIFVAIGNGQYQVWHPTPPTATFVETFDQNFNNNLFSGATAGCAFDPTYHPFTTNLLNNDVFRHAIEDPQNGIEEISVLGSGGAQPTSVALDGLGNSYVGIAAGNGLIQEYNPSGSFVRTLPLGTSKLKGGSPWLDLKQDGSTIFFTNGTNTVNQFLVACPKNCVSRFASISGATLFGLRVLTPAAQTATGGLLLVAAVFSGSSNIQLFNASGTPIKTYSVAGENNFQVLTLDPNGTSFWAGNPSTHNFYRFNLATGNIEVNAVNTGVGSGPTGLCAYGGFSAAEPQPITVTASFTSSSSPGCAVNQQDTSLADCTFSNTPPNGSPFAITLNGINFGDAPNGLQLAFNYSQIAPAAGTSDNGLACDTTAPGNQLCEVFSVDLNPNNGSSDTSIYKGFDLAISPAQFGPNPFVLKNELHDVTDFLIDPRIGGSDTTKTIFTVNEQPITTPAGSQSCGYISPLLNAEFNAGRTIPFKFTAVAFPNTCPNGPNFLTTLHARLELVQLTNLSNPNAAPHRVDFSLSDGTPCTEISPCFYSLSTNTWILNVSTKGLQGAVIVNGVTVPTAYLGTTIDDSHQIPTFSTTASGVADIFFLD